MNCNKVQKKLSEHFSRHIEELPTEIREHLRTCADCAAFAADLAALDNVMAASDVKVQPGELDDITFERIVELAGSPRREPKGRKVAHPLRWAWIPAAAAAIVLIFFLVRTSVNPIPDYTDTASISYTDFDSYADLLSSDSLGTQFAASLVSDDTELDRAADELSAESDIDDLLNGLSSDELKTLYEKLNDLKG